MIAPPPLKPENKNWFLWNTTNIRRKNSNNENVFVITLLTQKNDSEMVVSAYKRIVIMPKKLGYSTMSAEICESYPKNVTVILIRTIDLS